MLTLGIAGASGSGKTRLTQSLYQILSEKMRESDILVISEDQYYRDQSHMSLEQRHDTNYDHPKAFEHELLVMQIKALRAGCNVQLPTYDYRAHTRDSKTVEAKPPRVLLIEGILLFNQPDLTDCFNARIFLDTPLDICLARRIRRDTAERGRTLESVLTQWEETVHPMYREFVEPSRMEADLIIPHGTAEEIQHRLLSALISGLL